jgi:hypothetical protein
LINVKEDVEQIVGAARYSYQARAPIQDSGAIIYLSPPPCEELESNDCGITTKGLLGSSSTSSALLTFEIMLGYVKLVAPGKSFGSVVSSLDASRFLILSSLGEFAADKKNIRKACVNVHAD